MVINLFFSYNYSYASLHLKASGQWSDSMPSSAGNRFQTLVGHLGHCSAPWHTPMKHKQKDFCTHFDLPTGKLLLPGQGNTLFFVCLSFPLIQLNAKTDNDSLGLKVRKKLQDNKKDYLKSSTLLVTRTASKHAAVIGNTLQNVVYNKCLLQLWFQAHSYYFYAFLLNKTVKIKNKFQAE